MPVYEYKALDGKGKNRKGIIDAEGVAAARAKLRSSGKYPVSIKELPAKSKKRENTGLGSITLFERVRSEEVIVFTRQLATLLAAGIPLVASLNSLIEQTTNLAFKKVISQIKESVNEGNTLTNAMADHPKLFSNIYVNMIRAGEASGSLDVVLMRLADFGEKQENLKGRIKAALIYPIFMAVIGVVILFVLITYIVPNITQVFQDMDRVLPLPTRILIQTSDFLKDFWWLVSFLCAGLYVAFKFFVKTSYGRELWDHIKLKMPVIGPVIQKIILARFASTLGSLLESSVALIASMNIVNTIVNNVQIGKVIEEMTEEVRKGKSMSLSLSASPWFPPMFVQMVSVGEQSGELEVMLKKVAEAYEREVETAIIGMTSLIEPVMIAAMGGVVFLVVLSILLPIFEMNLMIG